MRWHGYFLYIHYNAVSVCVRERVCVVWSCVCVWCCIMQWCFSVMWLCVRCGVVFMYGVICVCGALCVCAVGMCGVRYVLCEVCMMVWCMYVYVSVHNCTHRWGYVCVVLWNIYV